MTTYNAVLVLIGALWWVFFRKRYDWRAVLLYYMGAVFVIDAACAGLYLVAGTRFPGLISLLPWLMPVGGIAAILYAASRHKLARGSGLFEDGDGRTKGADSR